MYVDGVQVTITGDTNPAGDLSSWNSSTHHAVAFNELESSRDWLGDAHKIAVYERVLTSGEISQLYSAGASSTGNALANGGSVIVRDTHIVQLTDLPGPIINTATFQGTAPDPCNEVLDAVDSETVNLICPDWSGITNLKKIDTAL